MIRPKQLFYSILVLTCLLFSASVFAGQNDIKYTQLEVGTLLVATDKLNQSEFHHSVIYITEHSDQGTYGVIINKPTHMSVNEAMPNDRQLKTPSKLYFGGPMHAQFLFVITEDAKHEDLHQLVDGLYFGAGDKTTIELNAEKSHPVTRTFIGFSSWGPGQLDDEVKHGVWLLAPGSKKDIFDKHPEKLWTKLTKQWSGDWI
jgi:putative transcriptional regulator